MYINYDYYHAFYHVAKCGNVTRAAKLLSLQSAEPDADDKDA